MHERQRRSVPDRLKPGIIGGYIPGHEARGPAQCTVIRRDGRAVLCGLRRSVSMRWLVEFLMRLWPLNRLMVTAWRYMPFPRGARSRIMRTANDSFLVGVMVLIQDDAGRILLVRNTYEPLYDWSLPGGWMGKHEQPDECIRRELFEETGYEIEVNGLVEARTRSRMPSVDLVFRGRITGGSFRASIEITEARFFQLDELPDRLAPGHRRLLRPDVLEAAP